MTRSFRLNARSALQILQADTEKFKKDELNSVLARTCAITAWHLCDHVFKELRPNHKFKNLKCLQRHVRCVCPELAYLRDICNESKHAEAVYPSIDEAKFQDGDFCHLDFDPHDFDVPRLEIKLPDGRTVLFGDILDRAVTFWTKFFDDNGIE